MDITIRSALSLLLLSTLCWMVDCGSSSNTNPSNSGSTNTTVSSSSSTNNVATSMIDTEEKTWCETKVQPEAFRFRWVLTNFTMRGEVKGEGMTSPVFHDASSQSAWMVELYPQGSTDARHDFLSIFICLKYTIRQEERATVMVTLPSRTQEDPADTTASTAPRKAYEKRLERLVKFSGQEKGVSECWGWANFIGRADLIKNYLPKDTLVMQVEVGRTKEITECSANSTMPDVFANIGYRNEVKAPHSSWPECAVPLMGFENLVDTGNFSDFKLKAGNRTFQVHKVILFARSPGLWEAIEKNGNGDVFVVPNSSPEVLEQLVFYLYLGHVEKLGKLTSELLVLSHQYEIPGLKRTCEKALIPTITVENAGHLLQVADETGAEELRSKAMKFVVAHAHEVLETPYWKNLVESRPHVVGEMFAKIVKSQL